MDWRTAKQEVRPAPAPTAPTLVELRWRFGASGGRVVSCGIYQDTAPGLDVRAGFSEDDILRTHRAPNLERAREVAAAWRDQVLAKGGFTELPLEL